MGERRKVYKILLGRPEGKIQLGRPRRRWEDGVKKISWGCGLDSSGSGQGPVVGSYECDDEPSGSSATKLSLFCLCKPVPRGDKAVVPTYSIKIITSIMVKFSPVTDLRVS
jgi:hypothetical protein